MTVDVDTLRALLAKATPGPWSQKHGTANSKRCACGYFDAGIAGADGRYIIGCELHEGHFCGTDAALIVAAVNELPGLLSEIERMRNTLVLLRDADHEHCQCCNFAAGHAAAALAGKDCCDDSDSGLREALEFLDNAVRSEVPADARSSILELALTRSLTALEGD